MSEPMLSLVLLALATIALVGLAWLEWRQVRRRETRADAIARAMQRGDEDDHACEVCGSVVSIREIVILHDDATLACLACAPILTGRRVHV